MPNLTGNLSNEETIRTRHIMTGDFLVYTRIGKPTEGQPIDGFNPKFDTDPQF
ncbi:hypothetical protein AVEN_43937-1, partial [Araneus ventricosus]